jgi:hypothetical protein
LVVVVVVVIFIIFQFFRIHNQTFRVVVVVIVVVIIVVVFVIFIILVIVIVCSIIVTDWRYLCELSNLYLFKSAEVCDDDVILALKQTAASKNDGKYLIVNLS